MMELKPCPFCGGEARMITCHNQTLSWIRYKVACYRCETQTAKFESHEVAIKQWNRRVGDDLMERMEDDGK